MAFLEWENYLYNLDEVLKEALKSCLKDSLAKMYNVLHGNGTTGSCPLFQLEADLIENKINFVPSLQRIADVVGSITSNLLMPLKISVFSLREKFGFHKPKVDNLHKIFSQDEHLNKLQEKLDNEVVYCFTQLQEYAQLWEAFSDMWQVNKDMFLARYEKLNPTVASFDADIGRYTEVANNVQMQEVLTTVHFLDINSNRLKAAIIVHCSLWQQKLTALLLRMTQMTVDRLYKYMKENGKK